MIRAFVISVMVVQLIVCLGSFDGVLGAKTRRERGWQALSMFLALGFVLWGLGILVLR